MKRKKFLDFYLKYVDSELPFSGLCCCFKHQTDLDKIGLFEPSYHERVKYDHGAGWWGRVPGREGICEFTPFRQNVILFLAAMNDEL